MERGAWTDKRLDDRFDHIDAELGGVRADIRELRGETRGLGGRVDALGAQLQSQIQGESQSLRAELHAEIRDLRSFTLRLYSGSLVAMVGLIAAVLARG